MTLRDILLQIAQVLSILLLAPLHQGIILRFEKRIAARARTGYLSATPQSPEALLQAEASRWGSFRGCSG